MILPRDKFRSRLITTFADFVCDEIARIARKRKRSKGHPRRRRLLRHRHHASRAPAPGAKAST
jgi:hypothetical protein